ncbi:MAG: alpha/beta fold hydrolase [Betaproteobacteria bacterium]
MHYLRTGSGFPPLVFVHGFACSHDDWGLQVDYFRNTHEVVACDLRGHGLTPGRPQECTVEHYGGDVAALTVNLDLRHAILIGHSMGCRVVLEAARLLSRAEGPYRVGGLALIDGSRTGSGDPAKAEADARAMLEKAGYPAFAETLFRQMFFKPSGLADAIVARAVKSSAEFGPHLWPALQRWDAAEMDAALAAVKVPLLVIQSTTRNAALERAPLKPGESSPYLELIGKSVPSARIEVIPDAGHFTQLEAADQVNRLIGDFAKAGR